MPPAARLSLEVGVSRRKYKLKITVHYRMGMAPVAVRFMVGFQRTMGIKALVVKPFLEAGVSLQQDKQKIIAHCPMGMDMAAVRFIIG